MLWLAWRQFRASVNVPSFGPSGLGGWILSSRTVDAAGLTISKSAVEGTLTAACNITRSTQDVDVALAVCAQKFGIHDIAQVHTSHQFWALQSAEFTLFVALAALTVAVCFWWLDHRST